MIRSKIISLSNTYHYYLLLFILIILIKLHIIFIIISAGYLLFIIKRSSIGVIISTIALAATSLALFYFIGDIDYIDGTALVTRVERKESYCQVEIMYQFKKYIFTTNKVITTGDMLSIKGNIVPFKGQTSKHGFDAHQYYLGNNIFGKLKVESITKKYHIWNLRATLEKLIGNFSFKTASYFNAFFFGESTMLIENFENDDISRIISLFGISLIHIYGIKKVLLKIFFHLDIKNSIQKKMLIAIDLFFAILANFNFLAWRLLISTLVVYLNKHKYLFLSSLDIKSITFFMILLFNSFLVFNQGFILSMIIVFMLELNQDCYSTKKPVLRQMTISALVFLFGLPLFINFSNSISVLAVFGFFLFKPLIKYIIYPLLFVVLLIPQLSFSADYVLLIFENLIKYILFYDLAIKIPSFEWYLVLIYYALLVGYFLIRIKVLKIMYLLFSSSIIFGVLFFSNTQVAKITFLDVGQGDSTIITYNKKVIVIDAYAGAYQYLVKNGISKIDLLILTHSDTDHIKDAHKIIKNLKVFEVIGNPYDNYPGITNIKGYQDGHYILLDDIKILFYGPIKEYRLPNNNSLVFQVVFPTLTVLFPGDMEDEAESDILDKYQETLKSDIYKLTHHGSHTNNMEDFLGYVKPKVIIISVSSNNKYNLPSSKVIRYLETKNLKYFRTDENGSIEYYFLEKAIFTYM